MKILAVHSTLDNLILDACLINDAFYLRINYSKE